MSAAPAPTTAEAVFERIRRVRLVPVIRVEDSAGALALVDRLRTAGLDVIEVTTTIDGWDTVIETIRGRHPEVCLGAGTVTTPALAARALEAGTQFCVSPGRAGGESASRNFPFGAVRSTE
jgi:2-dehydro-3-deoxyphosphogluconate aldolase/(4S)-4-hydroxy-2-oxoglutarate aldolase